MIEIVTGSTVIEHVQGSWLRVYGPAIHASTHTRQLKNGRTPVQILRGKEFRGELVQFGEQVWYRDPTPATRQAKLTNNWAKAIWIGKVEVSDEHLVCAKATELHKVRTIRRMPDTDGPGARWDMQALTAITALPW